MNPKFDALLCEEFPNLYRDRHADMRQTCMVWGFPGDGWFGLLYECSKAIEAELLKMPEADRPCASQVKEKWGTLRFYMTAETPAIEAAIERAEWRSQAECEDCGCSGHTRDGGYLLTLCEQCKGRK